MAASSAKAVKYEQVSQAEGAPAPPRAWSAKGNLWKMFMALMVVVGVYVSFTLVREQGAVAGSEKDMFDTYLSEQPPSASQLSFREEVRQAMSTASEESFKRLTRGSDKISPDDFKEIVQNMLHAGVSDAVLQLQRAAVALDSATVDGFLETVKTKSLRITFALPLVTERLFKSMDMNGDGAIEMQEFLVAGGLTSGSPDQLFAVLAGPGPAASISVAATKPVVLELLNTAVLFVVQVFDCIMAGIRSQQSAITLAVFDEDDGMLFGEAWATLNATLPEVFDQLAASIALSEAQTGKPFGIEDAKYDQELRDFEEGLLDQQDPRAGMHLPTFVDFLLRNSTLPQHPWATNPDVLLAVALAEASLSGGAAAGGQLPSPEELTAEPLPPALAAILTNVQGSFLNMSRETGSFFFKLAEYTDFDSDGVVTLEEYQVYWNVYTPLRWSLASQPLLDRLRDVFFNACELMMKAAGDEAVQPDLFDQKAITADAFYQFIGDATALFHSALELMVDVFQGAIVDPLAEFAVGVAVAMMDGDANGAVSGPEFSAGLMAMTKGR